MNIKQTIKSFFVAVALFTSIIAPPLLTSGVALAVECDPNSQSCCGGVPTSILECEQTGEGNTVDNTGLWGILIVAINILTGLVAVAALGGIVYGSILYTSAGGNAEQTKKAMGIITNVVIGIIAYGLMYVGLNFLVPGGVFN